jgi:hypothetical protein
MVEIFIARFGAQSVFFSCNFLISCRIIWAREWAVNGVSMECQWTVNGLSMECQWSVNGLSMECQWSVNGVSMDCQWSVNGVSMDCQWTVNGVSMECQCIELHFKLLLQHFRFSPLKFSG